MSRRIETADPLTLLRELPAGWTQTCIARPPHHNQQHETLKILTEVHRVLRDDGTLWLLTKPDTPLTGELRAAGWLAQPRPRWAHCPRGPAVYLFSKHPRYFYNAHSRHWPPQRPLTGARVALARSAGIRCAARVRRACPLAAELEYYRVLVWRCAMASTSPIACGACGTAYKHLHTKTGAPAKRRAGCTHTNATGRCLVLDPFYQPDTKTAEQLQRANRSFLAITSQPSGKAL